MATEEAREFHRRQAADYSIRARQCLDSGEGDLAKYCAWQVWMATEIANAPDPMKCHHELEELVQGRKPEPPRPRLTVVK